KYLFEKFGIVIRGFVQQIAHIKATELDWDYVNQNPFFCGDKNVVPQFEELITKLRRDGTSCGARLCVVADNVPVGWGEPVFDRLDADIAHAMMSINAVKAVEIGDGFAVVEQFGHEARDELTPQGFTANHSGGVQGGISSGQQIVVSIALKPTSSITTAGQSIDLAGNPIEMLTKGRHDPCVGVRATPIAEAMLAIVLMDHFLRHRAQNADVIPPLTPIAP
ncbi:MAG TPA: chorismate synthase, partial [Agitococcus sp.]|nr:chorismate synthase [Agitococcus sp.]